MNGTDCIVTGIVLYIAVAPEPLTKPKVVEPAEQVPEVAVDGAATLKAAVVELVSETGVGSLVTINEPGFCIEEKVAAADAPTVTLCGDDAT